jgi:hypothetical protein
MLRQILAMPTKRIALAGICAASAVAASTVLACAPAKVGPTAPRAASRVNSELPPAPPYLEGGLAMPPLDVGWQPPMLSAGDSQPLEEVLGRHDRLKLVMGPDVASDQRAVGIGRWVEELASGTKLARGENIPIAELVRRASLPLPSAGGPNGADELSLDPEILARLESSGEAALLVVDRAPIDLNRWRSRPAQSQGTCAPVLAALGAGQEQSLAILEPFLDHADAVLASFYKAQLTESLAEIESELAEYSVAKERVDFSDDAGFKRHSCGRQVLEYIEPYGQCMAEGETCVLSPRLFVQGGARIGAPEPALYVPDECPELLGRDYVAAMREPARRAAEDATDHLDLEWAVLVDRFATLGELHAALEDVCLPRRRRFSDADLEGSRQRLESFGELFRNPEPVRHDARWLMNEESFHSPGIGAVHQLARFDSGTGSAARELTRSARGLREFLLGRARCQREGEELPLVAMVVDLQAARVEFLGYFYDEELLCGDQEAQLASR